jgi:O-antigen/teichoic acid export membrane protein
LILYSTFSILTGIGLVTSLAVGWLVGTAIKKGSNGVGGRRYQIAAVALTYAAVSLSAIPIGISYIMKDKKPASASSARSPSESSRTNPNGASPDGSATADQPRRQPGSLASVAGP